ncbi:(Fe-S)-binding protein [Nocardioides sp. BP30]|uniref:(Fe-S)-binding protein n=1 Tax=Nocardioides sp. BP30 TaxID=3036374 RepID=UPI0024689952|nr:(Fe-S)-binding protein [Nocardioides sp. BP30]WGL52302.1 (Fe-S)-binding protein [Nocardioides sp. BP30]
MLQTIAIVVALVLTVVTAVVVVKALRSMLGVLRVGQPAIGRTDHPASRWATMLKETFGHTRMFQWRWVGVMHWFVYFGFLILATAVATGFVQLFDPKWQIPIIGHWFVYEWICEGIGVLSTVGIIFLIVYRQLHMPKALGRRSRFFGSTFWQAYFVEFMALLEGAAILFIRGAEHRWDHLKGETGGHASTFHFPISHLLSGMYGDTPHTARNWVIVIAFIKVASALAWLIVVALNLTMGIAWHRFTAWFNIYFKRESQGRDTDGATTALGAMKPLTSNGKAITLDDIDDLDEDAKLGVGTIEDFSWKGILDFTTCTECGRCQSQCPAWNTEKPLSPKHLVMSLREHAYASAPYLEGGAERRELPLVGKTDADPSLGEGEEVLDWFYNPDAEHGGGGFVIDEDVLWSCTSCGACVQQCPVDIEHVDHIMDMRRYQVLVESNFPSELNGLFKGLENKGNPWNMSPNARLDWAKDLPFDVKVVGEDLESLESVDWLFWVGCAGAYEDRAKKTTRAVAELLDTAGISFGVLGNGETCTGDPARRAGNEFVFQGLAQQNVETFKEFKVKKAVTTCAHCFNTLKNEYKQFGIELEVVHHTQLLNRLVREGKLTPVADGAGAHKRSITYHDPCYIGRHNGVYTPPRELLQVLPGAEYVEMPRNSERSFCCGAGGARMWMEEKIGQRINRNRTDEAVGTGADQIAVGCPFCRVMLSDGLTAAQADGTARESVEVLDVAQMLLASVKGEQATKLLPGEGAPAGAPAAPAAKKADVATKAEPSPGDVTVTENTITETADAGPAAKASQGAGGGSSLFDEAPAQEAAQETAQPAAEAATPAAPASGGSLFDNPSSLFDTPAKAPESAPAPAEPAAGTAAEPAGSGGSSLFDIPATKPAPAAASPKPAEATEAAPAADLGSGGSLFDVPATAPAGTEPAPAAAAPQAPAPQAPATEDTAAPAAPANPAVDLNAGGSLFDIPVQAPAAAASPAATPAPAATEPAEAPQAAAPQAPATENTAAPASPAAPAVDLNAGGSLFDIPATPASPSAATAAPAAAEPEPSTVAAEPSKPEPEPEPSKPEPSTAAPAGSASSGAAHSPRSDVAIEGVSSLFDIEAPAPTVVAPPATATAAASAPAEEAAEEAPAEEAPAEEAPAEEAPAEEAPAEEAVGRADPEPAPDPEPAAQKQATPPAASGATNTPRTDADIHGAGSLFDL